MSDQPDASSEGAAVTPDAAAPAEASTEQLWAELQAAEKGEPPAASQEKADDPPAQDDDEDEAEKGTKTPTDPQADQTDDTEALRAQVAKLEAQARAQNGRLSARDREVNRLKSEIAELRKDVDDRRREAGQRKDQDAKLAAAREEYPDVVGPVADVLSAAKAREQADLRRQEEALKRADADLAAIEMDEQAAFMEEHPDGFEVLEKNVQTFKAWIEDQPKLVRDAFKRNERSIVDAAGASLVVSKFKLAIKEAEGAKQKNPQEARRQLQLDGARSERSSPQRTQATPGDGASEEEWWEFFKREDAKKGRAG